MRNKVRLQDKNERIKNFTEVALGYSPKEAKREADRCLQCKNPLCVEGCPVQIDIPLFIKLIKEEKPAEALAKIKEKNNLPAVCGRVCPQENQCESACILKRKGTALNIGALERYAADYGKAKETPTRTQNETKIAVVGSGPAGLTGAADLAKMGYPVTLFESLHSPGGVLIYGIPEFRLPKKIVEEEIEYIRGLGVTIQTDILIGKTISLEELFQKGFKAIFLGLGAGLPQFLGIPGENLGRVYSANEFLTRLNLMKAYRFPEYSTPINIGKKIAVIGGGNVAFDSARCALRLGSEASIVYRRSETEMPARIEEIKNAKEEGVKLKLLSQPVKILPDSKGLVKGLGCIAMRLGEPDSTGRKKPIPLKESNFIIDVDTVIMAVGQTPNPLLAKADRQLKTNSDGTIAVNSSFMTSVPGVFAGGDIITGADTVIAAMGAGKKAAVEIDKYIKNVKS